MTGNNINKTGEEWSKEVNINEVPLLFPKFNILPSQGDVNKGCLI